MGGGGAGVGDGGGGGVGVGGLVENERFGEKMFCINGRSSLVAEGGERERVGL